MDLLKAGQKLSILFQKEDSLVEIACVISALLEDSIKIYSTYFRKSFNSQTAAYIEVFYISHEVLW